MYLAPVTNGYVAVVLAEGFSTLSLGAIVEPFSHVAGAFPEIAPRLELYGLGGRRVASRSGVVISCDDELCTLADRIVARRAPRSIILCGPTERWSVADGGLLPLLRLASRNGVMICGLGSATWLLAEAGLLDGGKGTVHWRAMAAFAERFRDLEAQDVLHVRHGNVISCAGESATLDMVLTLIEAISAPAAESTANHFLVSYRRLGNTRQPGALAHRLRSVPDAIAEAVRLMAGHIECPLQVSEIAARGGTSSRQLERMFQTQLATSPWQYYTRMRLERAHDLLLQTDMSVLEVALACGFGSAGALGKNFKRRYRQTPRELRENGLRINALARPGEM
ncbi:MAG: helix-turn-helix domain-containing protein [Roseovarius sp.]